VGEGSRSASARTVAQAVRGHAARRIQSNVRALTRVACEATEEYLLSIARHGTAEHVERLVRSFRRCKEAEELSREAQQQANQYLKYRYAEDGSLILDARLLADLVRCS